MLHEESVSKSGRVFLKHARCALREVTNSVGWAYLPAILTSGLVSSGTPRWFDGRDFGLAVSAQLLPGGVL